MNECVKHLLAGLALAAGRLTVVIPEDGAINWRAVALEAAQAFLVGAGAYGGYKAVKK